MTEHSNQKINNLINNIATISANCYIGPMLETTKREGKNVLSAGYPAVERLIDSEDFDRVNAIFEGAYKELQGISRKKKGLKRSREAKKAMLAIEHVMDLFKELLEIKYQLQKMLAEAAKGKKKV